MPGFDLREAMEKAIKEANKLPLKEPPLVLPKVVPISYGKRPEKVNMGNKVPETGTYSPPAPYETS